MRWRQGRSLPYGEGVTFWALAEIVKAETGILENDTPAQAEEKLRDALARRGADATERQWLERHLRPLAGAAEDEQGGARGERSPRGAASSRSSRSEDPLVLVFEDLHWADDALLDFVDQLAERVTRVPLLVLGTARPELLAAAARLGRRQAERPRDLALAALGRGDGPPGAGAARAAAAGRADPGDAPRPGRGQPALRRAVRAHAARAGRPRRAARHRPGDHRRTPRRARRGREAAAPGRSRRRQGLLARRARGPRRHHSPSGRRSPLRARAQGVRPASAALVGRRRERVLRSATCWSATSPTARSRAPPVPRSTGSRPAGSSRSDGRTIRPRCSRTTTSQPSS